MTAEERNSLKYHPADLSDAGNAELFSTMRHGSLRWCDALGWLVWSGQRWEPDDNAATGAVLDFSSRMLAEALYIVKRTTRIEGGKVRLDPEAVVYLKNAEGARSARGIRAILDLSKARLSIQADQLDAGWYYLNTSAGIIDLRTGAVKPHDPAAFCTKLAPFAPSRDGERLWEDHLRLVSSGDGEWSRYLQARVGSYAFGRIFHEGIEIAVGGGRNGKSTTYNAIAAALGDYAGAIDSTVLTTDRQNRGASLATLRGKRFVVCGELEEGQRLSVQTLKRLASTDPLVIEEKYRQPATIVPTHHVILFSNFLPRVGSTDSGTWRRLSVLPYTAQIPAGPDDVPNYGAYLAEYAGGAILSWIIEGARLFWEAGCRLPEPPEAVQRATEQYRASENWLAAFISECCVVEASAKVRAGDLYEAYKSFAQGYGDYVRRGNDFFRALEGAGYRFVKSRGYTYWIGLRTSWNSMNGPGMRLDGTN